MFLIQSQQYITIRYYYCLHHFSMRFFAYINHFYKVYTTGVLGFVPSSFMSLYFRNTLTEADLL